VHIAFIREDLKNEVTRLAGENSALRKELDKSQGARKAAVEELQVEATLLMEQNAKLRSDVASWKQLAEGLEEGLKGERNTRLLAEGQRDEYRARLRGRRSVFD